VFLNVKRAFTLRERCTCETIGQETGKRRVHERLRCRCRCQVQEGRGRGGEFAKACDAVLPSPPLPRPWGALLAETSDEKREARAAVGNETRRQWRRRRRQHRGFRWQEKAAQAEPSRAEPNGWITERRAAPQRCERALRGMRTILFTSSGSFAVGIRIRRVSD